jgi:hypothetical protein
MQFKNRRVQYQSILFKIEAILRALFHKILRKEVHCAELVKIPLQLLIVVEVALTSLLNDFDSKLVCIAQSAIVGTEEECFVQMVHHNAHGQLGDVQLVDQQIILVEQINDAQGCQVADAQLCQRHYYNSCQFVGVDVCYMIANILRPVKQSQLAETDGELRHN